MLTACAVEYCLVQSNTAFLQSNTAVCSRILPCAVEFESFAHQHSSDSSCHVDSKLIQAFVGIFWEKNPEAIYNRGKIVI